MPKLLVVAFIVLASLPTCATVREKITVLESWLQPNGRLVEVRLEIEHKEMGMWCDKKLKPCEQLPPGDYLMVNPSQKGMYQDCDSVDIYKIGSETGNNEPIGTYCF